MAKYANLVIITGYNAERCVRLTSIPGANINCPIYVLQIEALRGSDQKGES
jgi:hypothetical protein